MHILTYKKVTIPIGLVALIGAVVFGLSFKTKSQQLTSSTDERLQQIEKSADLPLRVVENSDSPLRILDAKVKEIAGTDFVKLTGRQTDLPTVCSVPEVRLLNSSAKTITSFILVIRDPASKTMEGIVHSKVQIGQGETYTASRNSFLRREWVTTTDNEGQSKTRLAPEMKSEKYWISFASRSNLFVTVAQVNFQDGSSWTIKEGGDIR